MKIKKSLFGYTKKSSSKKSIKLGRPDKWEVLFLILYGLSWYWFNDIVNVMSARGGWNIMAGVTSTLNIGLIIPMWITFIAFHIFLMLVIGRSIWSKEKGNTHHYIDLFVGIIILLGVFLLLISTVLMLSGYGTDYIIPWFFNLGRTTLYHIGVAIQVLGMIYFAMTK